MVKQILGGILKATSSSAIYRRVTNELVRHAREPVGNELLMERVMVYPTRIGEISLGEARFIGDLVGRVPKDRPIIEVGTLFGTSTKAIAMFKDLNTPLITVDNFSWNPLGISQSSHFDMACKLLEESVKKYNVKIVSMDKDDFYAQYDGPSPGLVFLDADHDYLPTKADIEWAKSVGAEVIAGHDYVDDFPGVKQAVAECGGLAELVERVFVLDQSN